jgi:hypothetical protein
LKLSIWSRGMRVSFFFQQEYVKTSRQEFVRYESPIFHHWKPF